MLTLVPALRPCSTNTAHPPHHQGWKIIKIVNLADATEIDVLYKYWTKYCKLVNNTLQIKVQSLTTIQELSK